MLCAKIVCIYGCGKRTGLADMSDHPNAALVNQTLGHVMEWMEKRDFQGVNCAPCGFTPMVSDGQVAEANSPFNESEPKAACCISSEKPALAPPLPLPILESAKWKGRKRTAPAKGRQAKQSHPAG